MSNMHKFTVEPLFVPNPNVVAYRPLRVERRSWAADLDPKILGVAPPSFAASLYNYSPLSFLRCGTWCALRCV